MTRNGHAAGQPARRAADPATAGLRALRRRFDWHCERAGRRVKTGLLRASYALVLVVAAGTLVGIASMLVVVGLAQLCLSWFGMADTAWPLLAGLMALAGFGTCVWMLASSLRPDAAAVAASRDDLQNEDVEGPPPVSSELARSLASPLGLLAAFGVGFTGARLFGRLRPVRRAVWSLLWPAGAMVLRSLMREPEDEPERPEPRRTRRAGSRF